jgi:phenylpropionate dioxygenase-like ring-hydroxylating dioxygenase large terminal subunit
MREHEAFLSVPYSAYHHRGVPSEDAELTHVGPGTSGGEYLRRFWQPLALSSELANLPLRVRALDEDLVLFRDRRDHVGLLELHCPHRGTSLEFGIVSERGIRCCYHGWLFDTDGRILETPGEPPESTLKDRLCHGAYPTREYEGLVFAYMGPPELKPDFPILDTYGLPGNKMVPYCVTWPCNWLQAAENVMDPWHAVFLHTKVSFAQFADAWGAMPLIEWVETPLGMVYVTTRRWRDHIWVRSNDAILPNLNQVGAIWEDGSQEKIFTRTGLTRWTLPIDDTHCMIIGWRHFHPAVDARGKGDEHRCGKEMVDFFGQDGKRPYEARQRVPEDYDAQVSQRPIAVHALEHLGTSDRGVIMYRRLLLQEMRHVANGQAPRPLGKAGETVPTYTHDTVLRIPPIAGADDRALLLETGRRVTDILVRGDGGDQRVAEIQHRVSALAGEMRGAGP